jgi:hypothetical protein
MESLTLRRSARSNSALLHVEHLEARVTPAGGKGPTLTFTVVSQGDPTVTITGQVTGTYAANSTVQFSGAVTYTGQTNSAGAFSIAIPANYLGAVTGAAWDNHGTQTNVLQRSVISAPPSFVSFTASYNVDTDTWTFAGQISNENLANQTVTFSGFSDLNGSTTTDASGYFSYTTSLAQGDTGTVTATVADCWNLTGTAQVTI